MTTGQRWAGIALIWATGLAFHQLNDHKARLRVLEERAGIAAESSS